MSDFLKKLKGQQKAYKAGKKKKMSGGQLPPGTYTAKLAKLEGTTAKNTGNPMVVWTWVVAAGSNKGDRAFSNSVLINETNWAYFNRDITKLGYELPEKLDKHLEALLKEITEAGIIATILVKQNGDFLNVYLQNVVDSDMNDDDEEDEYEEEDDDEEEEDDVDGDEDGDDEDEEDEDEDDEEDDDDEDEDDEDEDEDEEDEVEVNIGDPVKFTYKGKDYVGLLEKEREKGDKTILGIRVVGLARISNQDAEDCAPATAKELAAFNKIHTPAPEEKKKKKKKKK